MNATKCFFTLILAFLTLFCLGQKKENVYYLSENGKIVTNLDSVYFMRIVQEPDSGTSNYILKEFYKDGKKKRFGTVSSFEPNLVLEGIVTEFYKNGKRNKMETFVKNHLSGNAYYFYENGKIKEQGEYQGKEIYLEKPFENLNYKVIQYGDTSGHFFLDENGTGKVDVSDSSGSLVGNYLNGLKNGEWKEYTAKDSSTYTEIFEKGKFIHGKRVNSKGEVFNYNKLEVPAEFKGGEKALYNYLFKNLKYTNEAAKNKVQGRVFITFAIETDGSISYAKVIRGIGAGCDEEALRVINKSPKWNPGTKRGNPVRVSYTFPIFFQLEKNQPQFPAIYNPYKDPQF